MGGATVKPSSWVANIADKLKGVTKSGLESWNGFYNNNKPLALSLLIGGGLLGTGLLLRNRQKQESGGSALPWLLGLGALGLGAYAFRNELKGGFNLLKNRQKLQDAKETLSSGTTDQGKIDKALADISEVTRDKDQMKVLGWFSPETKQTLEYVSNNKPGVASTIKGLGLLKQTDRVNLGNVYKYHAAVDDVMNTYYNKNLPQTLKKGEHSNMLIHGDKARDAQQVKDLVTLAMHNNVMDDETAGLGSVISAKLKAAPSYSRFLKLSESDKKKLYASVPGLKEKMTELEDNPWSSPGAAAVRWATNLGIM